MWAAATLSAREELEYEGRKELMLAHLSGS